MSTSEIRIHVTLAADGWGDNATEIADVLRTTVTAPASIDAGELAALIGNDLWEEWCAEGAPAS